MSAVNKVVITYGTFDLFHVGHLNLLKNLKALGTHLVVGVSTDDFNSVKGKTTVVPYAQRVAIVEAIRFVDGVFGESSWDQKESDIKKYNADIFAMGDDWAGKFDFLADLCTVVYLPRTKDVSSTEIKDLVYQNISSEMNEIANGVSRLNDIVRRILLKKS